MLYAILDKNKDILGFCKGKNIANRIVEERIEKKINILKIDKDKTLDNISEESKYYLEYVLDTDYNKVLNGYELELLEEACRVNLDEISGSYWDIVESVKYVNFDNYESFIISKFLNFIRIIIEDLDGSDSRLSYSEYIDIDILFKSAVVETIP